MNRLAALMGVCVFAGGAACEDDAGGVELRLTTALTSFGSKTGDPFAAILLRPADMDGGIFLPAGTIVHGVVRRANRIGLGLVRERAALDMEFTGFDLPDGRRVPVSGRLLSIDNARESVMPDGRIRGILAAAHPRSFLQGLWLQPKPALLHRSAIGLTGASGRMWSQFSLGPVGAAGLFAARLALFRMAEPEITLTRGTEMTALLDGLVARSRPIPASGSAELNAELAAWAASQPWTVKKPNGQAAADIVNIFFMGSAQQLEAAFDAAGWTQPDHLDRQSFAKAYHAYNSQSGYPSAPVSKLLLDGTEPALVFQKSMNTISKRHHVRLWRREVNGQTVWLGAATHDIGLAFDAKAISFTHKIDFQIDRERRKIVNDLEFAGCVSELHFVERPSAVRTQGKHASNITDGRAALITLRDCAAGGQFADTQPASRPRLRVVRSMRRVLLETRHYLLRGNPYYWAWRGATYHRSRSAVSPATAGRQDSRRQNHADFLPSGDPHALSQNRVP